MLIGLIDTPVSLAGVLILRSDSLLITSISSAVSGLPCSNSMPAYRSSVFSRTITRSIGSELKYERTPLYCLQGRMQANRPRACRKWTLMLRKPVPTGVVIGAFKAHLVRRTLSITASGSGVPRRSMTSTPASCTSQ